jgi:hypothetical protein
MVPVVDGLEAKYQDQVEFARFDANSPAGKSAYQAYALRGHPGFVLLSPDGTVIWRGIGEQAIEILEEPIISVVDLDIEEIYEYNSFIKEIQSFGIPVGIGESVSQPFFTPQGQIVRIYGEDVQVFEYGSEDEAKNETELISVDGNTVGTSMVSWFDTPHFYRSGRIIVLYVGNNSQILQILTEIIGAQFAGG